MGSFFGLLPILSTLTIGLTLYLEESKNIILIFTGLFSLPAIWFGQKTLNYIKLNGIRNFLHGTFPEGDSLESNLINKQTQKDKLLDYALKSNSPEIFEYKLTPTRDKDSEDLMLEFGVTDNTSLLVGKLLIIIDTLGFKAGEVQEIFDEVWINATSQNGQITITLDTWGFVFILAENNNSDLELLDSKLIKSDEFIKK